MEGNMSGWLPGSDLYDPAGLDSYLNREQSFDYEPITRGSNIIHLVRLTAVGQPDEVCCNVTTHPLSSPPAYTALSYTWGRPDKDCSIWLNGQRHMVRKNLLRFLAHARDLPRLRDRFFWIDALCIDQFNPDERTHQVSQMAEIYRRAQEVLVWLGPGHGNSDLAMDLLTRSKLPKNLWSSPAGSGIRRLCQRSYWTRLWVVQELTLAKSVSMVCGRRTVPWSYLEAFLTAAPKTPPQRPSSQASTEYIAFRESEALSMIDQLYKSRSHPQLYHQILAFQHLQCAEPLDKIYALLGTVDTGHEDIRPDYRIAPHALFHNVLRNYHKIHPPSRLEDVVDQCYALASLMGLQPGALLSFTETCVESEIPSSEVLALYSLHENGQLPSPNGLFLMYWWSIAHNHRHVMELWHTRFGLDAIQDVLLTNIRHGNGEMVKLMLSSGLLNASHHHGLDESSLRRLAQLEDCGTTAHTWRIRQVGVLLICFATEAVRCRQDTPRHRFYSRPCYRCMSPSLP